MNQGARGKGGPNLQTGRMRQMARGYRNRYQIVDFAGGVPGDISITISWDG